SPAKIFMGDTGSLSLGGLMAGFALMTRTELLLVVLGGLFVIITFSVILQVGYFKLTGASASSGWLRCSTTSSSRAGPRSRSSSGSGSSAASASSAASDSSTGSGSSVRSERDVSSLDRDSSWEGVRAVVAGFGVSGFAAADTLTHLGADVLVLDESEGDERRREQARLLEVLGATIRLGPGAPATLGSDGGRVG